MSQTWLLTLPVASRCHRLLDESQTGCAKLLPPPSSITENLVELFLMVWLVWSGSHNPVSLTPYKQLPAIISPKIHNSVENICWHMMIFELSALLWQQRLGTLVKTRQKCLTCHKCLLTLFSLSNKWNLGVGEKQNSWGCLWDLNLGLLSEGLVCCMYVSPPTPTYLLRLCSNFCYCISSMIRWC